MKKLGFCTAVFLLFSQPVFAMLPLTPNTIQSAQTYGAERKGASTSPREAPFLSAP